MHGNFWSRQVKERGSVGPRLSITQNHEKIICRGPTDPRPLLQNFQKKPNVDELKSDQNPAY